MVTLMKTQQWWALGHAYCCVERSECASRSEVPPAFDQEISDLGRGYPLFQVERDPSVVSLVRRDADARIHLERTLPLDTDPEVGREALAIIMQRREGLLADAPRCAA